MIPRLLLSLCLLFTWVHAKSIKSTTGNIIFDIDYDGNSEAKLNSDGLAIGTNLSSSANLHIQGNGILTGDLIVGGTAGNSTVEVHGTVGYTFQTVSSNITLSGNSVVLVDTSGGNISVSLPYAGSVTGRQYVIKKISTSNTITLSGGGNNIDSHLSHTFSSGNLSYMKVISNGAKWLITAKPNTSDITPNTNYDLSYATYNSEALDISTKISDPRGMLFNADGTKLFILDRSADDITQYDLSTAYDISSATYNSEVLSVSAQGGGPKAMQFNNDGTNLYVVDGAEDKIFRYSVSTAYDISTASYSAVAINTASEETQPEEFLYNEDGTKIYLLGNEIPDITQYSLSTAYQLNTATSPSVTLTVSSIETDPRSMMFNNDGTKLYIMGANGDDINQYSLSTAYDVSSASFDSVILDVSGQSVVPNDMIFNNDGSKLYLLDSDAEKIYQYNIE